MVRHAGSGALAEDTDQVGLRAEDFGLTQREPLQASSRGMMWP